MKKKLLSKSMAWLLTICMVLSIMPAIMPTAHAAGSEVFVDKSRDESDDGVGNGYSTIQAAYAALGDKGGTIVLQSDVTLKEPVYFNKGIDVTLKSDSARRTVNINPDATGKTAEEYVYPLWGSGAYSYPNMFNIGGTAGIAQQITIQDITLTALGGCRVMSVSGNSDASNTVILDNCTITGGNVGSSGAGINLGTYNTIYALNDTTFEYNVAATTGAGAGGAVYLNYNSTAYFDKVRFEGNRANTGGAIYSYQGTVYCTAKTKFYGNYAERWGGAILNHGTLILDGTELRGNTTSLYGGAIYNSASEDTFTGRAILKDAKIIWNTAKGNGGGIYAAPESVVYVLGDTQVLNNGIPLSDEYVDQIRSSDNIYLSNNALVIVSGKLTSDEYSIGISCSNPTKYDRLVWSLNAATIGDAWTGSRNGSIGVENKTLQDLTGQSFTNDITKETITISEYIMSESTADHTRFFYDSQLWRLVPDSEADPADEDVQTGNGENMWLTYSEGNNIVFNLNLPGRALSKEEEIHTQLIVGEEVPLPVITGIESVGSTTLTFRGWYTAAIGGQKLNGNSVKALSGTTIYYAQWDIVDTGGGDGGNPGSGNLYLVYFDQNYDGGGLTSAYFTSGTFTFNVTFLAQNSETGDWEEFTEDVTANIPFAFPGNPVRTGYTFGGWGLSPSTTSGVGSSWTPSQAATTLYAIWTANTYTITWNANGGTGGTTTTQKHGTTLSIPNTTPARTGYTFTGWYADRNGASPVPADAVVVGNVTYYAGWEPNEYTITWDTNYTGGSVATTQQNYDTALVVQPTPIRNGYSFGGWWTQTGGRGTNAASYGTIKGNETFYAYWVTEVMSYAVTLEWDDESDNDAVRPESVTVELLRNGLSTGQTATLSGTGDIWTSTFTSLPVADAVSNNYVYSVAITSSVSSEYTYASDFATSAYAGYIRLTHTLITRDVHAYIVWNDGSDNDGYRPATVDVQLYANGAAIADAEASVTLPGSGDTWTYTFSDMQKYYNGGQEIVYTIVVTPTNAGELARYSTRYDNLTATLTHDIDTVSKTVITEWSDNNNQDNKRPASMTVQLYANNQPVQGKFVMLSDANGWSYTWSGLPKYSDGGVLIVYSAYVTSTLVDYVSATTEMTIEMTYVPSSTRITAFITWTDSNDVDGLRPDYVTAELIADGVPTGDKQQLSDTNSWRTVWENYPIYKDGQRIEYTFAVSPMPSGYTGEYVGIYDTSGLSAVLTHERILSSQTAQIVWNDNSNIAGARMGLVRVMLCADGSPLEDMVATLTEVLGWKYAFENLPVYRDGGQKIKYSVYVVSETGVYEAALDGMTVTLSYPAQVVDVPLSIIWDDNSNALGIRPGYVAVTLTIGGEASVYTAAATAANGWSVTFEGFPKYKVGATGTPISYGAQVTVPAGYTVLYIGSTAVLSAKAETANFAATVTWNDNGDQYGQRPARATLTLYADYSDGNGVVPTGKVRSIYAADDWIYVFEDLPVFSAGKEIIYSVVISGDISNYTPSYDGLDVYMRHNSIPEGGYTTSFTAKLIWADNYNTLNSRSYGAVITLYANDAAYLTYTLTTDDVRGNYTWDYTWTELPTHINGDAVTYTVGMSEIPGYVISIVGDTITLTHVKDITVSVIWRDNTNDDGVRPDNLTLMLYADGRRVAADNLRLWAEDEENDKMRINTWTYTFANHPVWSSVDTTRQLDYTYLLPEAERASLTANGYSLDYNDYRLSSSAETDNNETYTLTLSRGADYDDYDAVITWNDDTDRDGLRPTSVKRCDGCGVIRRDEIEEHIRAAMVERMREFQTLSAGDAPRANPKLTALRVELTLVESEIEKLIDTLTGANAVLLSYANKKIEALDSERQALAKAIADISMDIVAPEKVLRISGYLDDWENVSFDDKRQVADAMIATIRATSESIRIEWKI